MEENAAAFHTALNAAQALGRGFDVNYDTRLLYCKGVAGSRVVEIDEDHTRDLSLYDKLVLPNVSRDIKNFQELGGRDGSSVCSYNEVCLLLFTVFRCSVFDLLNYRIVDYTVLCQSSDAFCK